MKLIDSGIKFVLKILLPSRLYQYLIVRLKALKRSAQKSKSIVIAKKIVCEIILYPVKLLAALLVLAAKAIVLFSTTSRYYRMLSKLWGSLLYAVNELIQDYVSRGYGLPTAWKRFSIHLELFVNGREVRRSFGPKNPDKTFFVIRPYYFSKPNECIAAIPHLLTNYYCAVQLYAYATENEWIPVVDWENYRLPHSEDVPVNGTMNAWEYYWKQPSPYTLEEVYQSRRVILSNMNIPNGDKIPPLRTPKKNIAGYARKIVENGSGYAAQMTFNEATRQYIDNARESLFPKGKKVLGAAIRGTAYAKMKTGHHAVQPELQEMIDILRTKKEEWGADYIFFTNEEEETIVKMKEAFGDELIYLPRKRYKNYHIYSDNSPNPTNEDLNPLYVAGQRSQTNLEYIAEMALLSQCDFLVCALSNGIKAALLWNAGAYERVEILDKGTYLEAWEKNVK